MLYCRVDLGGGHQLTLIYFSFVFKGCWYKLHDKASFQVSYSKSELPSELLSMVHLLSIMSSLLLRRKKIESNILVSWKVILNNILLVHYKKPRKKRLLLHIGNASNTAENAGIGKYMSLCTNTSQCVY